jgi:TctA family transporter
MLGLILGPMLEEYFRRAMIISRGSLTVFISRPISATLLGLVALLIAVHIVTAIRRQGAARLSTPH